MFNVPGVPRRPTLLLILDGFGVNPGKINNAVAEANTANLDEFFSCYPHTTLNASGLSVGLPDGQMGNSEVGHLTLGAGHIIRQDLQLINDAISNGSFANNKALIESIKSAVGRQRPVHLLGLVSDGGVHSHLDHIKALIKLCRSHGAKPLLHMITDGRDTLPQSALRFLPEIENLLHESGGAIGSIMGRYYAMDRDNRWDRTELAWRALVLGRGQHATLAELAIRSAYAAGDTDEFINPILLPKFTQVLDEDDVIFFNFRKDRPQQMVAALGDKNFTGFDRGDSAVAKVTCMMPYNKEFTFPYAFKPEVPEITLSEVISNLGLKQFHCAETEKYAHVTYFFNGGRTIPYAGEKHKLIPSPGVATYDLKPSMSADKVADEVVEAIKQQQYGFIVVNFANGDMVGHTAKKDAVIEAVETLDREASKVLEVAEAAGYSVVLTADHGNCEELIDPFTGEPHTQHTTYPVPCLIIDEDNWQLSSNGGLSNVAATILQLMGIEVPQAMDSSSLLLKKLPGKRPLRRLQIHNLKGVA